jgi:ElaB/YqjD/DUF883 family membrane-anchored ribosome-binding protein
MKSLSTIVPGAIMDAKVQAVTGEMLADDLRILLADTEQLLKAIATQSSEKIAALQPRIEEQLRNAKARLVALEETAAERARAAAEAADAYAHEYPWGLAGIAGLLGVAIGLLIGRR